MLNIQQFTDTDGNQVEIDRRNVRDAYIEHREGRSSIQVLDIRVGVHGHDDERRPVTLGIGALGHVEAWLGRKLNTVKVGAYPPNALPTDTVGRAIFDRMASQPVSYSEPMKLKGGGVAFHASHPSMDTLTLTVTPRPASEHLEGGFDVKVWGIVHRFEKDEAGNELWSMPSLHSTLHYGGPLPTLDAGIAHAKAVAERERELRVGPRQFERGSTATT
jgi:hypothetical protein